MTTKVIHEPQLDTILMVEKAIKEAKSYPTKKRFCKDFQNKSSIKPSTAYSNTSKAPNKIIIHGRKIIWVFPDNPKLKKLLETSVRLR
jgi:hypothetical protein